MTKVLMVDDEEDFCFFVKLNLEKTKKYKVYTANRGAEGITLAQKFMPDIVLLDIVMPDMDGGEVALQIMKNEKTKNIPIIFITAVLQPADEKKLKSRHHFLSKPVTPDKLMRKIDTILNRAKS